MSFKRKRGGGGGVAALPVTGFNHIAPVPRTTTKRGCTTALSRV